MFATNVYRKNKIVKFFTRLFIVLIVLLVIDVILTFPITNSNFDAKLHNLTKDDGYSVIKMINLDEENTVTKAKDALEDRILQIKELKTPKGIAQMAFNYTTWDYDKKNDYLDAYNKFYASPYWDFWYDNEKLWDQYDEKKLILDEKNKLYAKERYQTARTENMYDEILELTKELELINNRITKNHDLAEAEYELFTKYLGKLYEKYY